MCGVYTRHHFIVIIFYSYFIYIHKSEEDPSINDSNKASKACIYPIAPGQEYILSVLSVVEFYFSDFWSFPVLNLLVVWMLHISGNFSISCKLMIPTTNIDDDIWQIWMAEWMNHEANTNLNQDFFYIQGDHSIRRKRT